MRDSYGRLVSSLRLSVTADCNQKCFYCHHEGQWTSKGEMTTADIHRLLDIAHAAGVRRVKITGGEPLMRNDILELVREAARLFDEVSLTTNGVFLDSYADDLTEAGLDRVNVSLDTLDGGLYERITGTDDVLRVIRGIDESLQAGLAPLKINTVLLSELNNSHLSELLGFAASKRAILQLIELNPLNGNGGNALRRFFYPLKEIENSFAAQAVQVERNELHDRKRYLVPFNGFIARVEVVRSVGRGSFCRNCTRIRVTSDGMLKPCLMTGHGMVDFLSPLRAGASDDDLLKLFHEAVRNRRPYWVAR
ncbi:MAG: GTP 3',8-cyclase MoaA [Thermoplasmata archaeon]